MTLLALLAGLAFGQVNNENLAASVAEDGLGVQLGIGGASYGGNAQLFDIRGNAAVQWRRSFAPEEGDELPPALRDRVMVKVDARYLSVSGTPFFDQRFGHISYAHMFVPRFGVGLGVQYQNNLLLLLRDRWTAGVGTRFVFTRGTRGDSSAGLSFLAEYEVRNVDPEGPDDRTTFTPRLVGRWSWRIVLVPDRLTWLHTVYAEPSVLDWSDLLLVDYNTLEAHVSKVVSLTADLQLRYDGNAPTGLKPLDRQLTWGLRFRWAARPDAEQVHH